MKVFLLRSKRGMRSIGGVLIGVLAVLAISASSASAFSWWTGNPAEPTMLPTGAKLPINSGGTSHSPFTLKWRHAFEVKCGGVTYDGMFLEGPVFLGASSIVFEQCVAKKPKHSTLVGGKIETSQLFGEIKP